MNSLNEYLNVSKSYSGWVGQYIQASQNIYYWQRVWEIWEEDKDRMDYFEKSEFWSFAKGGELDI